LARQSGERRNAGPSWGFSRGRLAEQFDSAGEQPGTLGVGAPQLGDECDEAGQFVEPVTGFSATGSATVDGQSRGRYVFKGCRTPGRRLPKLDVEGSSPFARFFTPAVPSAARPQCHPWPLRAD
jgi:hypothetical protein